MSKKTTAKDATMYKISENDEMFAMVKTNEGIIICCGRFKVSNKTFKTFEEADNYIASKPYEILINVSVLMCKLQQDENKENAQETATEPKGN